MERVNIPQHVRRTYLMQAADVLMMIFAAVVASEAWAHDLMVFMFINIGLFICQCGLFIWAGHLRERWREIGHIYEAIDRLKSSQEDTPPPPQGW